RPAGGLGGSRTQHSRRRPDGRLRTSGHGRRRARCRRPQCLHRRLHSRIADLRADRRSGSVHGHSAARPHGVGTGRGGRHGHDGGLAQGRLFRIDAGSGKLLPMEVAGLSNNPIRFVDEQYPDSHRGQPGEDRTSWKVLIVDDEPDVHSLTKLLLRNFRYRDRGLEYLSAFSAAEAQDLLREHPDIALVLLDVVMETEHAGLALVDYIRNELGNRSVQIVIRTGQAGQAPPLTVISNHGINDYREKTDLTQQTMILTVVKALRLYEDFLPSYVAAAKFANLAERARAGADDRELLRCLRQELEQSAPELPPA